MKKINLKYIGIFAILTMTLTSINATSSSGFTFEERSNQPRKMHPISFSNTLCSLAITFFVSAANAFYTHNHIRPIENKNQLSAGFENQEFDLAIIGAGAAGVSHAWCLKKQNPDLKIAIFEKEGHIGGERISYMDEQGRAHDMGAILEATNYYVIKELTDQAGVERLPFLLRVEKKEINLLFLRH